MPAQRFRVCGAAPGCGDPVVVTGKPLGPIGLVPLCGPVVVEGNPFGLIGDDPLCAPVGRTGVAPLLATYSSERSYWKPISSSSASSISRNSIGTRWMVIEELVTIAAASSDMASIGSSLGE